VNMATLNKIGRKKFLGRFVNTSPVPFD